MGAEMLLQYMWEHRLWDESRCHTTDGRRIRVVDPGMRNNDAGPDFFNAKIYIGERLWAGNVEVHDHASEWHRHGHDGDPAYSTVILHVVAVSDCAVFRPDGAPIPQMVMPYTADFHDRYRAMVDNRAVSPPCARELATVEPIYVTEWLTALGFERLYGKVERISRWLELSDGDWQATAYIALARALGFSTNGDAFEMLARSMPLRILLKHRDDVSMLEAALYGRAGFLERELRDVADPDDAYYLERLRANYDFIRAKYGLSDTPVPQWKLARMRPPNFPHRRIAVLVAMMSDGFAFGRRFAHIDGEGAARSLFSLRLPAYWTDHYDFGCRSAAVSKALSHDSVTSLLINAVIPLMYAYGLSYGNERTLDAALEMLQSLPAEYNYITRMFTSAGMACPDAFTSQAMVELRNSYCSQRKCIYCRLGRRFLTDKAMGVSG